MVGKRLKGLEERIPRRGPSKMFLNDKASLYNSHVVFYSSIRALF